MNIKDLEKKVSNDGATEQGQLSAEEYNTVLEAVQKHDVSLLDKAARIGFKGMTAYLFASAEDKQEWEETGVESWIDSAPLNISGTERKIQITNLAGNNNPYFTTASGQAVISVSFKSLKKDILASDYTEEMEGALFTVSIDKGSVGVWSVVESGKFVGYGETYSIDIFKYLAIGANRVVIKAVGDTTGAVGQLNIVANLTQMYLTADNFSWYVPFIEGQPYRLEGMHIGGNLSKTVHIKVSNEAGYTLPYDDPIGTRQYINSSYLFEGLQFPSSGTGVYNVEVWVTADGDTIETDHLHYNIICVGAEDVTSAQLVAISSAPASVVNYADNTLFNFAVYDKGATVANPHILVTATVNNNPITVVDEELKGVPTNAANPYSLNIEIESEESNLAVIASISLGASRQEAVYAVDNSASYPATSGAVFYMNPATRSNAQENREKIMNIAKGEEIAAEWLRMSWVDGTDGYTTDDNGRKCLLIPAGSRCVIDLQPLSAVGSYKTIEFSFKARNVSNYDEPVITICDDATLPDFRGVVIRPSNILLHSRDLRTSNLTQGIDVKDEAFVNTQITLIRGYKNYGNLAKIFVNGCGARSFAFDSADSWNNNGKIVLGSDTADLYIYASRVYDKGFEMEDAERNYVASLHLSSEKKLMYATIFGIRDQVGQIDYDKVFRLYNTITITMLNGADLPHWGLSKEYSAYCDVEFNFINLPIEYKVKAWAFILKMCRIEGQGTTSMNYWLWNLRWRLDKSGNLVVIYPNGIEETL